MSQESYTTSPYKILGVPEGTPFNAVRQIFKQKILIHHPDKGGDPAYFHVLQDAYKFILRQHRKKNQYRDRIEKEVTRQEYKPQLKENDIGGLENIHVDQKRFDPNKFNKMFDKFRVTDPNDQKGYTEKDFQPDNLDGLDFQGRKVGQEEFNRRFAMAKQKQSQNMTIYKAPEAMWSMESNTKLGKNFSLLGEDIDDFSHKSSNLECTDYKKAYESKLIDPDSVKVKTYRNVDQLKSDREFVPREMSEEDKRYEMMKEQEREQYEQTRQGRIQEFDQMAERNFMEINRRLIKQ